MNTIFLIIFLVSCGFQEFKMVNEIDLTYFENGDADLKINDLSKESNIEKQNLFLSPTTNTLLLIFVVGDSDLNGLREHEYNPRKDMILETFSQIVNAKYDSKKLDILICLDIPRGIEQIYKKSGNINLTSGIYIKRETSFDKILNLPKADLTGKFKFFFEQAISVSKNRRVVLDLWGHGKGILGMNAGDGTLLAKDIFEAVQSFNISYKIPIILFSACLMLDIGVIYTLKDSVEAISASPGTIPIKGSFYGNSSSTGILALLSAWREESSLDIAQKISTINSNKIPNFEIEQNTKQIFATVDMLSNISLLEEIKSDFKELVKPYLWTNRRYIESIGLLLNDSVSNEIRWYYSYNYPDERNYHSGMRSFLRAIIKFNQDNSTVRLAESILSNVNKFLQNPADNIDIGIMIPRMVWEPLRLKKLSEKDKQNLRDNAFYSSTKWVNIVLNSKLNF